MAVFVPNPPKATVLAGAPNPPKADLAAAAAAAPPAPNIQANTLNRLCYWSPKYIKPSRGISSGTKPCSLPNAGHKQSKKCQYQHQIYQIVTNYETCTPVLVLLKNIHLWPRHNYGASNNSIALTHPPKSLKSTIIVLHNSTPFISPKMFASLLAFRQT